MVNGDHITEPWGRIILCDGVKHQDAIDLVPLVMFVGYIVHMTVLKIFDPYSIPFYKPGRYTFSLNCASSHTLIVSVNTPALICASSPTSHMIIHVRLITATTANYLCLG